MELSAGLTLVLVIAVIFAPGVIAAVRAENPPPKEPDYKPDAQAHTLHRQLVELDEALMGLLAIELPRRSESPQPSQGLDPATVLRAHDEAHAQAHDLLRRVEAAARRLPAEAPQQAREIISMALAEADSALYSQGIAADASRALANPHRPGEDEADRRLRALEHALDQAARSWQRAREEIVELEILLSSDATPPLSTAAAHAERQMAKVA